MILYRYEAQEDEKVLNLVCISSTVLKETPCGYWVPRWGHWPMKYEGSAKKSMRWVSKNTVKRYAYADKKDAFDSYAIRKRRYLEHCERRLEIARLSVELTLNRPIIDKPEELCFVCD